MIGCRKALVSTECDISLFTKLGLENTPLILYSGGSNFGTVSSFVESSDY